MGKQWILEIGQPAMQTVDILRSQINQYEMERNDNEFELKAVQNELSENINYLETQMNTQRSTTNFLLKANDSLMLEMRQSNHKNEIDEKKYEEMERELEKYKKLSKELKEINEKCMLKNESL